MVEEVILERLSKLEVRTDNLEKSTDSIMIDVKATNQLCNELNKMVIELKISNENTSKMIEEVKNGLYIYDCNYGTGNSTFTIQPNKCYVIRDGKISEPVLVNVITGSVFQTLFDIDAVGNDLEFFSGTCGKNGQSVTVAMGGPTIRVKKLTIN